jgi:hypothetical protein
VDDALLVGRFQRGADARKADNVHQVHRTARCKGCRMRGRHPENSSRRTSELQTRPTRGPVYAALALQNPSPADGSQGRRCCSVFGSTAHYRLSIIAANAPSW